MLGCSGTFPGPESPCSSYLVEHDGARLVIDLGNGALGRVQRHVDLLAVDAVWVSHLHGDHCLDLVPYSYARRYHPGGLPPRLPVYGPAGIGARIAGAYEEPPADGLLDVYDFREVGEGTRQVGPFTVTAALVNHPVDSFALRVEAGGRSLVYSSDTGRSEALVALAADCDLFLCEASWAEEPAMPPDIHLTGRDAGTHAAAARARRLLLTHLLPSADPGVLLAEARSTYDGPLELARCGATYDV